VGKKTKKKQEAPAHAWKPGQSGNPSGRPKLPAELREVKRTTYEEFLTALHKYGHMTRYELVKEIERVDATMFEVMFANVVYKAAEGDKDARTVLLDRLWGKPKEMDVHLTVNEIKKTSTPELLRMARETLLELEGSDILEANIVEESTDSGPRS
jgi:hypothetical protein